MTSTLEVGKFTSHDETQVKREVLPRPADEGIATDEHNVKNNFRFATSPANELRSTVGPHGHSAKIATDYYIANHKNRKTLVEHRPTGALAAFLGQAASPIATPFPKRPSAGRGSGSIRRAVNAAGSAADRLRHTAKREMASAAHRRLETAVERAHLHVIDIPGHNTHPTDDLQRPPITRAARAIAAIKAMEAKKVTTRARLEPLLIRHPPLTVHAGALTVRDLDHEDAPRPQSTMSRGGAHGADPSVPTLAGAVAETLPDGFITSLRLHSPALNRTPASLCEAGCNGHGNCTTSHGAPACQCHEGWVGMLCDMPRCEHDCNRRGICLQGRCVCDIGWLGATCAFRRCKDDCSGSGYCFEGKCHCRTGFHGENCGEVRPAHLAVTVKMQRVEAMRAPAALARHMETATLRSLPARSCPDNCNNRGTCSRLGECQCFAGYSGSACQSFCPNECSHQGACVESACLCFAGFLGIDCSIRGCCNGHGSCDNLGTCTCDAGYSGDDCATKLVCADPRCSGHGSCMNGMCKCSIGFSGPSCAVETGGCMPACGMNGACNPATKKCECATGFAGPMCTINLQTCPNHCNNKGLCMNGQCLCGTGWMGVDCGQRFFTPGQKLSGGGRGGGVGGSVGGGGGIGASMGLSAAGGGSGGHRGISDLGGAGGTGTEVTGVGGSTDVTGEVGGSSAASVEEPEPIIGKPSDEGVADAAVSDFDEPVCGEEGLCSGHGKCEVSSATCICDHGFAGSVCELAHCPGFFEVNMDCYGHGLCHLGNCKCAPGWGKDPTKAGPDACQDKLCPVGCGQHGRCVDGVCVCQHGWQGPNCKDPQCPANCTEHGQCSFGSANGPGQCQCDYGWAGAACQRPGVYTQLRSCPNDCSGNGLCMDGFCTCNVGFKGIACDEKVCDPLSIGPGCDLPRCPNDCHGQGLCMNGVCACWAAFTGVDCKVPAQCWHGCRNPCESGSEQQCGYCIAECETVRNHKTLGRHSAWEDLQSTLLQRDARSPQRLSTTLPSAGRDALPPPRPQYGPRTAGRPRRAVLLQANETKSGHAGARQYIGTRTRRAHHEVYLGIQFGQVKTSRHHEVSAITVNHFGRSARKRHMRRHAEVSVVQLPPSSSR